MRHLQKQLSKLFRAPAARPTDPYRHFREEAKRLATLHHIEVEKVTGQGFGGINVWPPKSWTGTDPFDGDHHAQNWGEVLHMVRTYAGLNDATGGAT